MALSALGVLDLSIVTDRLIELLNNCISTSPLWDTLNPPGQPFTIHVSGSMPETKRKLDGCQLTVSLIHVAQDKFQRNSPVIPPAPPAIKNPPPARAQLIPFQPLSVDLYYLVTAFADDKYVEEQQAMSIALNCFYQNPIVRKNISIPGIATPVPEEFTMTMEIETCDELARLWQAITVAYRFSVVYKVSVVFLTPPAPDPSAKQVARAALAVDSSSLPYQQSGQVIGTFSSATYATPHSSAGAPDVVTFDYSPATVVLGQNFLLCGGGLKQTTSSNVYLLIPDPASPTGFDEVDVTLTWKLPDPDAPHQNFLTTDSRIALQLPATVAAMPLNAQSAGVYQLRVGNNLPLTDPKAVRSNATPFSIAAPVTGTPAAPNPPILSDVAGTFTVKGQQFDPIHTQVLLETIPLTLPPGALQPGTFKVVDSQTITFQKPANISPGFYAVRIRVNQVESPPGWWIKAT
jgi:Pvc16 N-terminal domain